MTWCDRLSAHPLRACGFVLALLLGIVQANGQIIDAPLMELESEPILSRPADETRVLLAWPSWLPSKDWVIYQNDTSTPLFPALPVPQSVFGSIDWLTHPLEQPAEQPEEFVIRADNGLLNAAENPDLITLVRGGTPQLFGARGRLRLEYGDEFDEIKRIRGQLLLNLIANHIGIDTSVNSWEDSRKGPRSYGDFWTGDANLVYSMGAQRVAMRGGLGAAWVYDDDLDLGYNFTYGADLFLTRPWLVSGEVDWGRINNEKLFHWRATFGVQLLLFEIYIGYDSYKWDRFRFDGPVVGAGLWF